MYFHLMSEAELRRWVEENPGSVNSADPFGKIPLFYAVEREYPALATWLVDEKGAKVNVQGYWGQTPLHHATSAAVIAMLLTRGADVTVSDRFDRLTPLMSHIENNRVECVKRLLQDPRVVAGIESQSEDGRTALQLACATEKKDLLVPLLLQAGANPTISTCAHPTQSAA
jgi:ankyrin repeat protein